MAAYVLAKSSRGPVLFSTELLNRLRAAHRSQQGLRDNDLEWEGTNGGTCSYTADDQGNWTYSCDGEEYQGGNGVWSGHDAWGNVFEPTYSGGDLGGATVSASSGPASSPGIDWSSILNSIGSIFTGPPATNIGLCPPGTGRGKNGAQDYVCTPFDPPSSSSGQRQRDAATQQQALQAARAAAARQQQNPNGSPNKNGWPWWVWLLIGVGAYEVLK
jgi:hypothetical protein